MGALCLYHAVQQSTEARGLGRLRVAPVSSSWQTMQSPARPSYGLWACQMVVLQGPGGIWAIRPSTRAAQAARPPLVGWLYATADHWPAVRYG